MNLIFSCGKGDTKSTMAKDDFSSKFKQLATNMRLQFVKDQFYHVGFRSRKEYVDHWFNTYRTDDIDDLLSGTIEENKKSINFNSVALDKIVKASYAYLSRIHEEHTKLIKTSSQPKVINIF